MFYNTNTNTNTNNYQYQYQYIYYCGLDQKPERPGPYSADEILNLKRNVDEMKYTID